MERKASTVYERELRLLVSEVKRAAALINEIDQHVTAPNPDDLAKALKRLVESTSRAVHEIMENPSLPVCLFQDINMGLWEIKPWEIK